MAGNGRPVIGERVELRLAPATVTALDAEAKRRGIKRAELIRELIEQGITTATCATLKTRERNPQ